MYNQQKKFFSLFLLAVFGTGQRSGNGARVSFCCDRDKKTSFSLSTV